MPTAPQSAPASSAHKVSLELHALNACFGHGKVSFGELVDRLGERAYTLLLVLLALPFFTPVSLLGISTLVGGVIAYLGVRLALGLRPHLPGALRRRRLPPRFFGLLLRGAERTIRVLEHCTRRRLPRFGTGPLVHRLAGMGIVAAAMLLMLPVPLPLTNTFPAATIVLLALGLLEEDGAMVLAGGGLLLLSTALFASIGYFGVETFDFVRDWFRGGAATAG